ncbi:hypothetical protein [Ralstonia pseudosolanacearum]|uniref:hypothetical protein n=1 Tax=Ralstonia pseudosolanacearum TaxID=1310165 RepID=UPI001F46E34F|nr:hypothetical protein [Ralstonia pseudosolanacearum]
MRLFDALTGLLVAEAWSRSDGFYRFDYLDTAATSSCWRMTTCASSTRSSPTGSVPSHRLSMITLSVPVRNGRLAVIGQALDAGAAGGLLRLYSAPRPDIGQALAEQVLLPRSVCRNRAWGAWRAAGSCSRRSGRRCAAAPASAAWARLCKQRRRWWRIWMRAAGERGGGRTVEAAVFAGGAVNVELAELTE